MEFSYLPESVVRILFALRTSLRALPLLSFAFQNLSRTGGVDADLNKRKGAKRPRRKVVVERSLLPANYAIFTDFCSLNSLRERHLEQKIAKVAKGNEPRTTTITNPIRIAGYQ